MTSELVSPSAPNPANLITALLDRAPRVAMAIAAGQFALPIAKSLREKARERTRYTIKVPATDEIYDELHEWVLSLLPSKNQRALVAWTSKGDNQMISSDNHEKPARLRLRYDGSREQVITMGPHRIKVVVSDGNQGNDTTRFKPPEIVFTTQSLEAQRHLLNNMNLVVERSRGGNRKPRFRMLSRWGDWQRLDELPSRNLDSVILRSGQLERLIADVSTFLNQEQDYLRRCIPWHRGHLYEGPPGTGKTSVARALATHFNMDIWYLPLADIQKDCNLLAAVGAITPRSMLLLEDADVFHAATQRNDDNGVTLSGLLNALDGITTPHGLLTILTTNVSESLDAAVIRPGRVDLVEHFGNVDEDQASRLMAHWYEKPASDFSLDERTDLSPAEVIEVCKQHDDPSEALRAIAQMLANQ